MKETTEVILVALNRIANWLDSQEMTTCEDELQICIRGYSNDYGWIFKADFQHRKYELFERRLYGECKSYRINYTKVERELFDEVENANFLSAARRLLSGWEYYKPTIERFCSRRKEEYNDFIKYAKDFVA